MEQKKIDRINELARKQKTPEGLTDAEKEEQQKLRREYIDSYKASLTGILDNAEIKNPDGSITPVRRKKQN